MRLREVEIHNFRGILDGTCRLQDYSLLVGANNAGKSTVIDAIRAFYEKGGAKFDKSRDFPFVEAADQESWIELEFSLSDDEHTSLADEYKRQDKVLRVRKRFQTREKLSDGKAAEGFIFAYKPDGSLSAESFYGAKNVQSGKFGDIVFIPAVSKVDEHTKLSGPSALRDLLTDVLEDVVEDSKAFVEFNTHFEAFAGKIKDEQTEDGRSLTGLEGELNKSLGPWGADFRLKLNAPKTADIIKSMLGHEFLDRDHGKAQSVDQYGSGFQRQFIYSLIDIASRYVGKKPSKKTKDFAPSLTLILFEEPEAFLHPPQQESMARGLRKLAAKSDRQVLCSTHSSHFVSKNAASIPSLARLSRVNGKVTIHQLSDAAWKHLADSNQAINDIAQRWPVMKRKLDADDLKCEMEAVKHCLWLNPDRCGLFFANHVLLVEGPTEAAFINRLIGDGQIRSPECGLYVLDCLGKYNIHRFMNLLKAIGLPHAVIFDDDGDADEHKEINELIRSCCDKGLTLKCQAIPDDLETLLGIPTTAAHRKPQHVLFLLDSGKIEPAKVASLCALVDGCLPQDAVRPAQVLEGKPLAADAVAR